MPLVPVSLDPTQIAKSARAVEITPGYLNLFRKVCLQWVGKSLFPYVRMKGVVLNSRPTHGSFWVRVPILPIPISDLFRELVGKINPYGEEDFIESIREELTRFVERSLILRFQNLFLKEWAAPLLRKVQSQVDLTDLGLDPKTLQVEQVAVWMEPAQGDLLFRVNVRIRAGSSLARLARKIQSRWAR